MAELIAVLGESGRGKSRGIIGLDSESTLLISTVGKRPPIPGVRKKYQPLTGDLTRGNFYVPDMGDPVTGPVYNASGKAKKASDIVVKILRGIISVRPELKTVVIDDYQYFMATEYMQEARRNGWEKFSEIAIHAWQILEVARNLPDDITVFVLTHPEEVGSGENATVMFKTIGKMFREKVTPEGFFPTVLMTEPIQAGDNGTLEYRLRTQTLGRDVAKSPEGMFPLYIANDFGLVLSRIHEHEEEIPLSESKLFDDGVSQKVPNLISL
jgi:hypothetical protein